MKRSFLAKLIIVFVGMINLLLFQNCSSSGFTASSTGSSQNLAAGAINGITLSGVIQLNLTNALVGGLPSGLILENGSSQIAIPASATTWVFPQAQVAGSAYSISVLASPAGLTCSIANASGNFGTASVTNPVVTCSDQSYTLGGSISGLSSSGLILANSDGQTLSVNSGASTFVFAKSIAYGSAYTVSVKTQPANQTCSIAAAASTMGPANTSNVVVTCSTKSYSLGGTISSGYTGTGLVLANGSNTINIASGATSFTFSNSVANGGTYAVVIQAQPTGWTCSVAAGNGTISANVSNVAVTCSINSYAVGGTSSGITASGLSLSLNGGTALTVASGASSFIFPSNLNYGASYNVTITSSPSGLTCSIANNSGTVSTNNVSNITVVCTTSNSTYTIGGSVTGLVSGQSVMLANGSNTATVSSNSSFLFSTAVVSGTSYKVTVSTQPTGGICSVTNGAGTVSTANVTNISVTCSDQAFSVSGTITGLTAPGLVLGTSSSNEVSPASGAATFTLPTAIAYGSTYAVSVISQPTGMICTIANGSATMAAAVVTNLVVTCSANSSSSTNTCAQNSSSALLGTVITNASGTMTTNTYNSSANSCPIETTYGAVYGECYGNYAIQPNVYGAWGTMPANINFSMWSNSASCWGFIVSAPAVDFANPYYWNAPVATRGFSQGANTLLTSAGGEKVSSLNTTYASSATHCPTSGTAGSVCTKWSMSVPGVTAGSAANTASDTYTSWDALIDIYFHAVQKPTQGQLTTFDLQIYQMVMDEFYGGKPAWATYIFGSGKYTTKTISGTTYLVSVNMGDPGSEGAGWVGRGGTYNCISLVPLPTYPTTAGGTGSYLWGQASAVSDVGGIISWISQVETRVNSNGVSQTGIFDDAGNLLYDNVRKANVTTPLLDPTHYLTGLNPGFEVILSRTTSLEHPTATSYPNNTAFTTNNLWIALPGESVGN